MKSRALNLICSLILLVSCKSTQMTQTDILVVGGGASGVAAGVQSARMGVNTLIIEETPWVGGMLTSAGVSAIDGNYNIAGGIWGEFKTALTNHYGTLDSLKTGWVSNVLFEPSVGHKILKSFVTNESKLKLWNTTTINSIVRKGNKWRVSVNKNGVTYVIDAQKVIDATELGDVAKMCGVKYDIGMESKENTKESIAPQHSNNIVQDLTYVAILKDYKKDVTIPRPEGYDSTLFACACASPICITPKEPNRLWSKDKMLTYGKLPNNKYMINWPIEGNDYYVNLVEMNPEQRVEALKYAKNFTMCFLYYMQKELGYKTLGLADDEYPTIDKLPFIPYHRESRRIHGEVRFTLNHITKPYEQLDKTYRTTIAVGDYPVDHHHTRYHGYDDLPNLYFYPIPSYGLPLGTMIPKEVDGLIVAEKSISVSNLANGTTRLQPVVLQIGQAAGALAALSVKGDKEPRKVSVRSVQNAILNAGGYLLPYLDVKVESPLFKSYQRIGATGILRGEGKNVGWSNQTWLRTDTILVASDLVGLKEVYPSAKMNFTNQNVSVKEALTLIEQIAQTENISLNANNITELSHSIFTEFGWTFDVNADIKRGQIAVLIDRILDPFNKKDVDIQGNFN